MGRTYKRELDEDGLDDPDLIDLEIDDDEVEWITRPNEARSEPLPRRNGRAGPGRSSYRGLPDDWQDFDYGGDTLDPSWR